MIGRDLRVHRRRVAFAGGAMREGMTTDFVAIAMQRDDLRRVDCSLVPVAGQPVHQPAGHIEGAATAMVLEHRCATVAALSGTSSMVKLTMG